MSLELNPLSAKLTKLPNTLKRFVGNFVGLALKGLNGLAAHDFIEVPLLEAFITSDNLVKVNSRSARTRYNICSTLTIKTPEWRRFGVFIVNFEHI